MMNGTAGPDHVRVGRSCDEHLRESDIRFRIVSQVTRQRGAPSPASANRWGRRRCWGSHCWVLARRKPQIVALTTPLRVLSIPSEEYDVTAKYQVPEGRLLIV